MKKPAPPPAPTPSDSASMTVRMKLSKLHALDRMAREAGMTRSALIKLAIERLLRQGL